MISNSKTPIQYRHRRLIRTIILACITWCVVCVAEPLLAHSATHEHKANGTSDAARRASTASSRSLSEWRGWDYLVHRLRQNGVSDADLRSIYSHPLMPTWTFIPFRVHPREPASMYRSFDHPSHHALGASFIERHKDTFDQVESSLRVPREVVAAILVVESQIGKNTGKQLVVYRLSRLASANAPENLRLNYKEQKRFDPRITFEDVQRRGRYLEQTFLQEIPALIEISKRNSINIFDIKGSGAGAFGIPQFLPSAFLRFGIDGNKDGIVALHNEIDAVWSTANYLASFGFRDDIPVQEKRSIIWRYNRSKSYIDAILRVSSSIKEYSIQRAAP